MARKEGPWGVPGEPRDPSTTPRSVPGTPWGGPRYALGPPKDSLGTLRGHPGSSEGRAREPQDLQETLGLPPDEPRTSPGPPATPKINPKPPPEIMRAVLATLVKLRVMNGPSASSQQPANIGQQPATNSKTLEAVPAAFVLRSRKNRLVDDLYGFPSALSLARQNAPSD